MKKLQGILLTAIIIGSMFGVLSMVQITYAETSDLWPGTDVNGDGKIDIDDAIKFMADHFIRFDEQSGAYIWSFSNPYDIGMANAFINSVSEAEYIRDQNRGITLPEAVAKILQTGELVAKSFDGSVQAISSTLDACEFVAKEYLTNDNLLREAFDKTFEILLNKGIFSDALEATNAKTELVDFLVEMGSKWLNGLTGGQLDWEKIQNEKLDTLLADGSKYPTLKSVAESNKLRLAFNFYELANVAIEHLFTGWQILNSETIIQMVKNWELGNEAIRGIIHFAGVVAKQFADPTVQNAIVHGCVALTAVTASVLGPFSLALGVGAFIVLNWVYSDIMEKAFDWGLEEVILSLDRALYKKLADAGIDYSPWRVKVEAFLDQNYDGFIPWGPGCQGENVYVIVKNIGPRKVNVRVDPESASVPHGWEIYDNEFFDLDNYREHPDVEPGQTVYDLCFHVKSGTIDNKWTPWDPSDDEWIPGENPGVIEFNFIHDMVTSFWDIFDMGNKFLMKRSVTFYNNVEAYITVSSGLYPKKGEKIQRTVEVANMKSNPISFVLGVSLEDPSGESKKYDPQIMISPSGKVSLDPSQKATFIVEWTVPLDAPTGFYKIAVNCWNIPYTKRYVDNLEWKTIFFAYQLTVLTPTPDHPAKAGDPTNPGNIFAFICGLPPFDLDPIFVVEIGTKSPSKVEVVDRLPVPIGYTLKIACPTQPKDGKYDLKISMSYGALSSSDTETNAVEYTLAPSAEPAEKGLAWLRTSQYGDGSWRGSVGVTALCALAFLNAGYDEADVNVGRAIQYIMSKVSTDGSIYVDYSRRTYETSLAVLTLVATHNNTYRTAIENAKTWLVNSQWDESCVWGSVSKDNWYYGGFGYGHNIRPDLSNTQFAMLALDAAGLPKNDPTWNKTQVFLHRCQRVNFPITLNIEGTPYTVQPGNYAGHDGGYDGGFVYTVDNPYPYGGSHALGSMTGAGIWGLLLSGVSKTDPRVTSAINWVIEHYTWDNNVGTYGNRRYYTYLSLAKALTMYGEKIIGGHDWYQEL
ncbi:MAG: prenyltransferase/squalene oxidase repeat-containing protein, partial [Candidatus Bathyarchaeia archaeon]